MLQTAKIKIREIKELQDEAILMSRDTITPLKKCKKPKVANTTSKKLKNNQEHDVDNNIDVKTNTAIKKTTTKKLTKFSHINTPANQKTIDSYFKSCAKTFEIKQDPAPTPLAKQTKIMNDNTNPKKSSVNKSIKTGRKRLFTDTDTEPFNESNNQVECKRGIPKLVPIIDCITIDSDSDNDKEDKIETENVEETSNGNGPHISSKDSETNDSVRTLKFPQNNSLKIIQTCNSPNSQHSKNTQNFSNSNSKKSFGEIISNTSCKNSQTNSATTSNGASFSRRKPKPCPPYKIIENTTFAVDAFQFGYIENVTHYFLTHFHADHYIGLTKSFAMPLFVSPITARLLRTFIPVEEKYIHILELNDPYTIDNIEITALDANHCPGAILLVFKFLDTGKCILHTGDFRAWHGMESEPIFWNNDIHTIYLDTTYISDKYVFCSQDDSLLKAKELIEKFHSKNPNKKVLYICGTYIVGKEKFWCKLAETYKLKVWAEGNRYKALKAINDEAFNKVLVEDPLEANMHVIAMGKLTYFELVEYFKTYEQHYDIVLGIRPSGWEKDTKPRLSGKINLIGIEYSEHSSYAEMKRFIKFLKPQNVISTVPTGKDPMITANIPVKWYKYDKLKGHINYQPTIDNFMHVNPVKTPTIRPPNMNKGGVENFVSPLQTKQNIKSKICMNNPNECKDMSTAKSLNILITRYVNDDEEENFVSPLQTKQKLKSNVWKNDQNECEDLSNVNAAEQEECFVRNSNSIENISIHSSEEFERNDVILSHKKPQANTGKLKKRITNIKDKGIDVIKEKQQGINLDKNTLNKTKVHNLQMALNSEECFEAPNILLTEKRAPVIRKQTKSKRTFKLNQEHANKTSQQETITQEENNLPNATTKKSETKMKENVELSSSPPKRRTRSQNSSSNSKTLSQSPTNGSKLSPKQNVNGKTRHQVKSSSSKLTNKEVEKEAYDLKSSCSNETTSPQPNQTTIQSSPHLRRELEHNSNSQFLTKSQENPLLKSTTTTSRESISSVEFEPKVKKSQTTKTKSRKRINRISSSETTSEEIEGPKKSKRNKYTKSITQPNTKDILSKIIEEKPEEIDRFNCSQMACEVMETIYKLNPDNSKDHIPIELLSDEESSWQTARNFEQDFSAQKENNNLITNCDVAINENSNSSENLLKSPTTFLDSLHADNKNSNVTKTNISISNDEELLCFPSTSKAASLHFKTSNLIKNLHKLDDKTQFNFKDISITRIDDENSYDRTNCSQLAGLVLDMINKQNPDNSKDHIPIDLLSDADDDWM